MCLLDTLDVVQVRVFTPRNGGCFFPDSNKPRVVEYSSICIHYTQIYIYRIYVFTEYMYIYIHLYIYTIYTINIKFSNYCNIYIHTS